MLQGDTHGDYEKVLLALAGNWGGGLAIEDQTLNLVEPSIRKLTNFMKWILIFLDSFTIAQVVEFDKTHCIAIQFFLDSFTIAQVVEFDKTHCIVIQLSLHKCNLACSQAFCTSSLGLRMS